MQELDDIGLLREYVAHDSEEAFAALVARHVNKVYSVALRHTHNPHQAEEITQPVFVILAKKSRHPGKGVVLSGWLYQTARLTAVTFIRGEIRRARREEEAGMQNLLNEGESGVWPQIAPLLDAAMAVVLRYFDGRSMREVGTALGASEDAAKTRVSRAVEKLRRYFTRRGVVLPAAVLTAAISANSVQAAPVALAKTATALAMMKGATASASTLTLIKGALKLMSMTKLKLAIIGAMIVAAVATPLVIQQQASGAEGRKITLRVQNAPLAEVIRGIEKQSREKILFDRKLTGTVTLDVKDSSLAEVLDLLAPQAGARWSKVFAVNDSEAALRALEDTFRGGRDQAEAGWTNLAPQLRVMAFPGLKSFPRSSSFSTNFVIPASEASNLGVARGGGGIVSFTRRGDNGETTTVSTGGGTNGSMRVMGGAGGVSGSGSGGYQVVKTSSRGTITDAWSSERLVMETSLVPRLSGAFPESATSEIAATTATQVHGRVATYHVLSRKPDGFMSFKRAAWTPPGARSGSMIMVTNGQTNIITQPDEVMREIQRIQKEQATGSPEKSPEQQVLDAREQNASQKKP